MATNMDLSYIVSRIEKRVLGSVSVPDIYVDEVDFFKQDESASNCNQFFELLEYDRTQPPPIRNDRTTP